MPLEVNGRAAIVEDASITTSCVVVSVDTLAVDFNPSSSFGHDPTIFFLPSDGFTLDPENRAQL